MENIRRRISKENSTEIKFIMSITRITLHADTIPQQEYIDMLKNITGLPISIELTKLSLTEKLIELIKEYGIVQKRIQAIKYLRSLTKWGLKDCKMFCDKYWLNPNIKIHSPETHEKLKLDLEYILNTHHNPITIHKEIKMRSHELNTLNEKG